MFKEKKYQVIKNAISYELANFAFNYQLLRRQAVAYMYEGNYTSEYGHYGTFKNDRQVPGVYAEYSDMVMETLLVKVLPILEKDILNWMNHDKGMSKTNIKGWHSTTDMYTKTEYKRLGQGL